MRIIVGSPGHRPCPAGLSFVSAAILIVCQGMMPMSATALDPDSPLGKYLAVRAEETNQIPSDRRQILEQVAAYVRTCRDEGQTARLTFICTHNSRRSQFSQVWAAAAAAWHGVEGVETYSGGTEATAFNERAVAALRRAGWHIQGEGLTGNPRYRFVGHPEIALGECFSKVYHQPPNPSVDFCAVMTCSDADEACPSVPGAVQRIALPYEDPRLSDGTAEESAEYDRVCRQIAREMSYLFSRVAGS
jgi:arsenate reductase (thioredoxin)